LQREAHMRRRIHVILGGGYMSYEEEDTRHQKLSNLQREAAQTRDTRVCP